MTSRQNSLNQLQNYNRKLSINDSDNRLPNSLTSLNSVHSVHSVSTNQSPRSQSNSKISWINGSIHKKNDKSKGNNKRGGGGGGGGERGERGQKIEITLNPKWFYECAKHLYDKYVSNDCDLMVNVSGDIRSELTRVFSYKNDIDALNNLEIKFLPRNDKYVWSQDYLNKVINNYLYHIFDCAFEEIWHLVRRDSFVRFKKSKQFEMLKNQIGKNIINNQCSNMSSPISNNSQTPNHNIFNFKNFAKLPLTRSRSQSENVNNQNQNHNQNQNQNQKDKDNQTDLKYVD